MRRTLTFITAIAVVTAIASPTQRAEADSSEPNCRWVPFGASALAWMCDGEVVHTVPASSPSPSPSSSGNAQQASTAPRVPMKTVSRARQLPDGTYCWFADSIPAAADPPPDSTGSEFVTQQCPVEPTEPGVAPPTPAEIALAAWESQELPPTNPSIPPGKMVVGMPAYLVTDTEFDPAPFTTETPLGTLTMHTTSELMVDWGDGTTTGPYKEQGKAYPNGNIGHVYQHRGTYDIRITQWWSGTWQFGGSSGTLPPRDVTTVIPAFPTYEIQAVVSPVE